MATLQNYSAVSAGGISIQGTINVEASGQFGHETILPAAKAGSLTTRTDDNTGIATLATGHGITTGQVVDVYWADGIRYGMSATVDGNDVTVDGGAGDNLPAEDSDVTVAVQVTITQELIGNNLALLGWMAERRGHVDLQATAGSSHLAQEMVASSPWAWAADQGIANPIAGDTVNVFKVTNGDSAGTSTVKLCGGYDSDG